jgi:hypothetical protein
VLLEALFWCLYGPLLVLCECTLWVVRRLSFVTHWLFSVENRSLQTHQQPYNHGVPVR